jgi:hypothetical protein
MEVTVLHPPVAIALEHIVELLFQSLVVVPSFVLVGEFTGPLSLAPRVSDSNQHNSVDFSDLLDSVGVVKEDTRVAHAFFEVAILILHGVCAADKEALRVPLLEVFPELASLDCLLSFRSVQVELLRHSSCQIDECFGHLASIEHLVGSVQLSVSFFHKRNPKLIMVSTMAIKWCLALGVVWNSSINNHVLPATILEELENCKSVLDTIIDNQVFKKLRICALNE